MSKVLVIAEKPSVGRDIARVLQCPKKLDGALEGGKYIVTWGLGHLVTLCDPEHYDKKYKEWKMEDLPYAAGADGDRCDPADGEAVPGGEKSRFTGRT